MSLVEPAARVMTLARAGAASEAGLLARSILGDASPEETTQPSSELAALWLAVAVLEHVREDSAGQVLAANSCLALGLSLGSAGWVSNALSTRAMARVRQGNVDLALRDLARAEVELEECTDELLRSWGHAGVGFCYDQLRLYELAQPHLEASVSIASTELSTENGLVHGLNNLAELHLRWAGELERVTCIASGAEQVSAQLARARQWAREALRVALTLADRALIDSCERLDLRARADDEPQAVLNGLRVALGAAESTTPSTNAAELATALARALRALDRAPEALSAARIAVAAAAGLLDWQVAAAAHYLLVELEAETGVPGAEWGRAYGRLLSDALWQQRLQTLQGAQSVLEVERLTRTTDVATRTAREDPLTGLGNRRAFDEALVVLGESPTTAQQVNSLVLIDVDDFKLVNDTFGHVVGDDVLRLVSRTLRACARRPDLLIRLGGDEFVVLAAGASQFEVTALAARLHEAIEAADWGAIASGLRVHVSIGHATTGPGTLLTDLVRSADASMYADKRRSRSAHRRPA